jgi:hypothetical protein
MDPSSAELDKDLRLLLSVASIRAIRRTLVRLRELTESETEAPEVTWESPYAELRWNIPWNWKTNKPAFESQFPTLLQKFAALLRAGEETGKASETLFPLVLAQFAKGVGLGYKDGKTFKLYTQTLEDRLHELPKEERKEKEVEMGLFLPTVFGNPSGVIANPITGGFEPVERWNEVDPCLVFEGEHEGDPYRVHAFSAFWPLVNRKERREIYWPVMCGVLFEGKAHLQWDKERRARFWDKELLPGIDRITEDVFSPYLPEAIKYALKHWTGEAQEPFRSFGSYIQPIPTSERLLYLIGLVSPPLEASSTKTEDLLVDIGNHDVIDSCLPIDVGRAIADREALSIIDEGFHLRRLPRNPGPSWHELLVREVHRLREELGEEAFPSMIRRRYSKNGGEEYKLTSKAEHELEIREGLAKGFRWRDPKDGKEWFVRLFQHGKGFLRIKLSWYGLAGPWTAKWIADTEKQIAEHERNSRQRSLFDNGETEQAKIELLKRRTRAIKDAHRVMEIILGQVSRQKTTAVRIHATVFRELLKLWKDKDWKAHIETVFEACRRCEFSVNSFDTTTVNAYGSFIGEWRYEPAGPGKHGDGDYLFFVMPGFLGCLTVFQSGERRIEAGNEIVNLDFTQKHTEEQKAQLGWGYDRKAKKRRNPAGSYVDFDAGRALYNSAEDFSPEREKLVAFLEHNITKGNSTAKGKERNRPATKEQSTDNKGRRIYTSAFCPLLPTEKRFVGALGNFWRYAENGWRLSGTESRESNTGGKHTEGLVSVTGRSFSPGRANSSRNKIVKETLEDIKAIVMEYLGGVTAVRLKDEWLSFEQATKLPAKDLQEKSRWYFFVPETWEEDRRKLWERRTREAAKRGDTPHPWRLPSSSEEAEQARRAARGEVTYVQGDGETARPLHHLLRARRLERGLSQDEIAKLFGVSRPLVNQWENGTKAIPPDRVGTVQAWLAKTGPN